MPRRLIAVLVLTLPMTPACSRIGQDVVTPTAHADPTTTRSSPAVKSIPSAFPSEKIDTLLLGLDEVNRIASPEQPTKFFNQMPTESKPSSQTQPPSTPCGKALAIGTVYSVGSNWSSYRSAEYSATQNLDIRLIVAVYPSEQLAEESFSLIGSGAKTCVTDDEFSLDAVTNTSVQWHSSIPSSETHSSSLKLHDEVAKAGNVLIQIESSDPSVGANQVSSLIAQVAKRAQ